MISKRVPITINKIIKTTNACIKTGETDSAKTANGLTDNIMIFLLLEKVFSIDNKIDQPRNLVI